MKSTIVQFLNQTKYDLFPEIKTYCGTIYVPKSKSPINDKITLRETNKRCEDLEKDNKQLNYQLTILSMGQ